MVAVWAGSVAAADASTTIQRYSTSQTVLSCADFDVIQAAEVQLVTTVFAGGSTNETWLHFDSGITFTNSVTGAFLTGRAVSNIQLSSDDTGQQAGVTLRIVIAGVGAEVLETGVVRTVDNQVVFQAGQFDSSIDLCAALG